MECKFDKMSRRQQLDYEGPECECFICSREREIQGAIHESQIKAKMERGCSKCGTILIFHPKHSDWIICPECESSLLKGIE